MNYKDLFYILGGVFNFEIIMSFAAYDAIEMILNYKKKFLNLTLFEAAYVIFCKPELLKKKKRNDKKQNYKKKDRLKWQSRSLGNK